MDANDLLMGGGVKSAVFPNGQYGTEVGGKIIREPVAKQQTDFDTGKPKFYDNGDPMMQVIVHVQTSQRDPQNPDDDGVRALYIKGQMTQAVRQAVRGVGGKGLEVGGELYVRYDRDEPNSRGRGNDKKIYSARYVLPTAATANGALMGNGQQQGGQPEWSLPAQPAQQQHSAYQQATGQQPANTFAPPAANDTPPAPAGVDPALWPQLWAQLGPEQKEAVRASLGGR